MIETDQMPERYRKIITDEVNLFKEQRSITVRNSIPDTSEIPIENPKHWFRIPDVVCVFVDMVGSTKLSAESHDNKTAGAYRLFTGTAVRLFNEFESPYIDIRGDGVFALFDSNQCYRALAAAVSFKTFACNEFVPRIEKATDIEVGCHIGVDQKTVLVRKLGFKRYGGRTDRQNEVWAGKPVNMASKLASMADNDQMLVSDRYYAEITDDLARLSCGCPSGEKVHLWSPVDLEGNDMFDFDTGFRLLSNWCATHGADYCERILELDDAE